MPGLLNVVRVSAVLSIGLYSAIAPSAHAQEPLTGDISLVQINNSLYAPKSLDKPVAPEVPKQVSVVNVSVAVHKKPEDAAQVLTYIDRYAREYGVDPRVMTEIARCESSLRSNATNGPYAGIFQFIASTWVSNRAAMGLDTNPALRLSAEEAAKTAAFKMARDGFGAWPACAALSFGG